MEKTSQSRRAFIKTIALFLASMALLWRYLTPRSLLRRQVIVSLPKAELPAHGALVYREARVAIFNAESGLYALSLVCTHLGCTLNVTDKGLSCPCHGSLFDLDGNVLKGPAERPLQKMRVEEQGGMIEVVAA
jgi:cytochrome b6-f complex iron-sulfur subunit